MAGIPNYVRIREKAMKYKKYSAIRNRFERKNLRQKFTPPMYMSTCKLKWKKKLV